MVSIPSVVAMSLALINSEEEYEFFMFDNAYRPTVVVSVTVYYTR